MTDDRRTWGTAAAKAIGIAWIIAMAVCAAILVTDVVLRNTWDVLPGLAWP